MFIPTKNIHRCFSIRFPPIAIAVVALAFTAGWGENALGQSYTTSQLADGFDFPCGKPHGNGYYVYRGFSPHGHMGEDWNGDAGGDSDLGAPVYSIATGVIVFSENYMRGWGNVTIIRHAFRARTGQIAFIDSLYGHLQRRYTKVGQRVTRGEKIGTIGKGPYGMYAAHLHFEIRKDLRVGMRRDLYAKNYNTYYSPRSFLDTHRNLRYESRHVRVPINTFLRSNPNRITTSKIELPKADAPTTVRPDLSEKVATVIEEETKEAPTKPAKSKSLFERLFSK